MNNELINYLVSLGYDSKVEINSNGIVAYKNGRSYLLNTTIVLYEMSKRKL